MWQYGSTLNNLNRVALYEAYSVIVIFLFVLLVVVLHVVHHTLYLCAILCHVCTHSIWL